MTKRFPKLFIALAVVLFLLNLIQSGLTELIYDEAYYWYYAKTLAWGYFDHPPLVAFMIYLGTQLFDNELGVRLVSCIFSVGTYFFLWLCIDNPKKDKYILHFFLLEHDNQFLHGQSSPMLHLELLLQLVCWHA